VGNMTVWSNMGENKLVCRLWTIPVSDGIVLVMLDEWPQGLMYVPGYPAP
jgi:hypothetical protein